MRPAAFVVKDHLGSTRVVVSGAGTSNETVEAFDYLPFGQVAAQSGGSRTSYRFTG